MELLFLGQSFSNGALVPLGCHATVLWGPRAEAEQTPKLGIFIDEQGPQVLSLLQGATVHESLRTTVVSDTDKFC